VPEDAVIVTVEFRQIIPSSFDTPDVSEKLIDSAE
jgi:hypothetical protein